MKEVFHFFLIIFCSSLLVWQCFENIKTYLSHPTAQRISSQSLLNSGFPKIEICLTPGFNLYYLNSIGYSTLTEFAKGIVKYNDQPFYGWNGNGTHKIDQVFENASMLKNFSSIAKSYTLNYGGGNETDSLEIKERKFRYPDGKCFDLNIKLDASQNVEQNADLKIIFQEYGNNTVNIKITDPNREYFISDEFTFFGKEIKKPPLLDNVAPTLDIYRVQIKENVALEEDKEANCEDYEEEEKESFKHCVKSVVEKQFLGQFSCMSPWFTENIADMCDNTYTKEKWKNMSELIFPTLDNTFLKECKAPCKTMEINSRMIRKVVSAQQGIKILFDPTVCVTRSNPTMTIMTLFSNLGGVVGLTLGYSILQIVQHLDSFIQISWETVKQKMAYWKMFESII